MIKRNSLALLRNIGLLAFGYILILTLSSTKYYTQQFFTVLLILILLNLREIWKIPNNEQNFKKILLVLLLIGGVIRFCWAIFVPTLPVDDFSFFHANALKISQGYEIFAGKSIGYTLLLSLGYRFSPVLLTGKLINAFSGTLSLVFIYNIGTKLSKPSTGLIAVFLFAILPVEINMVSVLGTEVITSTMVLASTNFLLSGMGVDNNFKHKVQIIFAGLFFGLGFTMRIAILFYFPVFVFGLFALRTINKVQKFKVFSLFLLGTATGIGLIIMGYSISIGKLPNRPLGHNDSYPILAGTNIEHLGQYNMDDVDLFFSWPIIERDALARSEALRRIFSNPIRLLGIFPQKINIIGNQPFTFGRTYQPFGYPLTRDITGSIKRIPWNHSSRHT